MSRPTKYGDEPADGRLPSGRIPQAWRDALDERARRETARRGKLTTASDLVVEACEASGLFGGDEGSDVVGSGPRRSTR